VLLASGYIAGGAIAGIVIAFLAGVMGGFDKWISGVMEEHNPLLAGANADVLSLIPFVLLCGFLYLVAREKLLNPRKG
jgi:hypothetical protein